MKHTKRILAVLMALFMLINGVVLAHADYEDGKECPECGNYRWDDWVECYDCGMCIDCAADYICPSCGECTYCAGDRCDGCGACPDCGEIICSECDSHCFKCADDSKFCITCGRCGECNGETVCPGCTETCGECGTYDQCDDDCLFCENCADICTECGDKCYNCADEDEFCQACGRCGKCNGDTVCPGCHENCGECESKDYCSECFYCEDCGERICTECGKACFNCSSDDKFCVSCGRCGECNGETVCPGCCETCGECSTYDECDGCLYCENCVDYICENCGDTCTHCADEFEFCNNCDLCLDCNGGTTCPECAQSCFECEYVPQCSECYRCEDCAVLCLGCDKVCEDCAEDWCQSCGLCGDCNGHTACPDCGETCMECNEYGQCYDCYTCEQCTTICEECGEICIDCAYSFCENCNTCSECNGDTVCETCYNTCALCEANPQCKECLTCENCVLLCTGCGEVCMECAADGWCTGCDTCADCNGGTACLDCGNSCLECETIEQCADCYLCANCTTVCTGCGDVCIDCAADGWCTGCDTCADCNGGTACPDCGETCESCGNEDQCGGCYNCAACADICINCGDFCSMCDLDYNEETHMCGNCDVHDVDAAAVIGKINAIGTVELTPESKAKIDAAAAAFKSLSDEQQALVGNFNTLRAAQAEYKQLKNQEDKRKANLVTAGINNLGTISFSSESNKKIAIAKKMYASLTADQKALVTNYDVLEAAIARYDELKQEAYDQAAADDVIGRISAIGTVTYSDSSALKISRARNDYNVLTNTQKALVTNYSVLTAAEAKYAQLQAAANQTAADKAAVENAVQKINAIGKVEYTSDCKVKIDEARNTYNALTATQKALVTNYAVLTEAEAKYAEMEALHEAIDAINAIGAVGFTTECKAKIDAARNAYNALSDAQKAQITNYKTLTAAEAEYAKLKAAADLAAADQAAADAVIAKIGAIGTVDNTDASKAKIDVARNAYNALSYKQKSLVTNFNLLTAAETKYAQMKKSVEDKAAADSASAKISAIGTVEYSAESKKKINDAAVAYNALTAEQKALVDNHATLAAAQAKYDELKAAAENPESPKTVKSVCVADVTLNCKKSTTLIPQVTADDGAEYTVQYESSNPKVAKVDSNGNVYAAKKGTAEIKVTVTDQSGNTVTDTCKITVKYTWWQWIIKVVLFGWTSKPLACSFSQKRSTGAFLPLPPPIAMAASFAMGLSGPLMLTIITRLVFSGLRGRTPSSLYLTSVRQSLETAGATALNSGFCRAAASSSSEAVSASTDILCMPLAAFRPRMRFSASVMRASLMIPVL